MIEYTVKVDEKGTKYWYLNGKFHREDGPAIELANGTKFWFRDNKLHREDGFAVEHVNGTKCWYLNDRLHREDGPAVEYVNGTKYWYLNGIRYSEEDYWDQLKPVKELTVAEIEALLGHRIKVVK